MTTDLEREVREGLHRRAASIRPSVEGLDRIRDRLDASEPDRRRPPGVLLAAATVIAIVVIGGLLWAIDEEPSTNVATTPEVGPPPAEGEGVDTTTVTTAVEPSVTAIGRPGIWPWAGDDTRSADRSDPRDLALRYLLSRFDGELGDTPASDVPPGDPTSGEIVFTGDIETTVLVRTEDGEQWYVVAALSDLLELVVLDDGAVEYRPRVAGELTGNAEGPLVAPDPRGPVPVTPDMTGSFQPQAGDDEVGILRHWFTLTTDEGTTGFTEVRVDHR